MAVKRNTYIEAVLKQAGFGSFMLKKLMLSKNIMRKN
jgi:hypothetical protein